MIEQTDLIVVNYQTHDYLTRFVESYLEYRPENTVLHIVDVTPEVPFFGFDPAKENLDYMILGENKGYAHAVNYVGSNCCEGEYLGIFNADTQLTSGVIESCVSLLENGAGIVGPRQISLSGVVTSAGVTGTHAAPQLRGWNEHDYGQYTEIEDVISVSGSAYFMRRDCWDELTGCPLFRARHPGADGPWLPTFLYYEETWCSYHAAAHGWPVVYNGAWTMYHDWHRSIEQTTVDDPVPGQRSVFEQSRAIFRQACAAHELHCD